MEIKETMELLEGCKIMVAAVKSIGADGKLNLSDLPEVLSVLKNSAALVDAVKNADQIPAELKDLTQDEANQIIAKVFEVLAAARA